MNLLYFGIGLGLFILMMIYWGKLHSHLKNHVEEDVKDYFLSKELKIINFENANRNPKSPFYKKWNFAPSTGIAGDLFKHRFYKVDIINSKNQIETNWIDCLYFLKYKCWFVVKKSEIKDEFNP